jgi:hypothetical protein
MMCVGADLPVPSSPETGPTTYWDSDATAELVAAAAELEDTPESVDRLCRALAAAELIMLVQVDIPSSPTPALVYVDQEGMRWIPVWSSSYALAQQWRDVGRGDEEIRHAVVLGADLIRHGLPELPPNTGVILDPGQPHARTLPAHIWTATDGIPDQLGEDG